MRVVPCLLVIAWLCLGTTGCSLFQKKPKDANSGSKTSTGGAREPARFPGAGDPIRDSSVNAANDISGILAGTVIDEGNGRPKDAYIRWVSLDEPAKKDEAPIDVAVLSDGSFMIRGLKRNQHYKLTARAKEGSRMLAGFTYATAPDTRVLIVVKASLANAETPPLPPPPAYQPKQEEPKKTSARPNDRPALSTGPGWNPPAQTREPASLGTPRPLTPVPDLPARVNIPLPPPPPPRAAPATPTGGWVPGIAAKEIAAAPTAQIPNPLASPPLHIEKPIPLPAPPAPPMPAPSTTARVPSCVLVGRHLINFALYDLNHQPWEYKAQKKGKLVLLDFWGTWCAPCKRTIPHLVGLQGRYGPGLEVIGVAYEQGGSFQEKANRVGNACQANRINYRVLLGGEAGTCPLYNEFAIRGLPTVILLDENGWIIWRHMGELDRGALDEVEFAIKSRLRTP